MITCRKLRYVLFALATAVVLAAAIGPGAPARAEYRATITYFHDPLAEHGRWVHDPEYGIVWFPYTRAAYWSPYVEGRWIYTTDYGWYWDSYEPWGWATYHYGRWVVSGRYGWVWVPDDQWGPAWVEWRYTSGYVGWTPMHPHDDGWHNQRSRGGTSVSINYESTSWQPNWVFVEHQHFADADVKSRRLPVTSNGKLLSVSTRATNYVQNGDTVANRSISLASINASRRNKITPITLTSVASFSALKTVRGKGKVGIFRPTNLGANAALNSNLDLEIPAVDLEQELDIYSRNRIDTAPNSSVSSPEVPFPSSNSHLGAGGSGSVSIGKPNLEGLGGGLSSGGGLRIGR